MAFVLSPVLLSPSISLTLYPFCFLFLLLLSGSMATIILSKGSMVQQHFNQLLIGVFYFSDASKV